jgi:hypothetical protein
LGCRISSCCIVQISFQSVEKRKPQKLDFTPALGFFVAWKFLVYDRGVARNWIHSAGRSSGVISELIPRFIYIDVNKEFCPSNVHERRFLNCAHPPRRLADKNKMSKVGLVMTLQKVRLLQHA